MDVVLQGHLRMLQERIESHLANSSCIECGLRDPRLLDFDHIRGTKSFQISDAIMLKVSMAELEEELDKCETRCRNCHILKHHTLGHEYLNEEHLFRALNNSGQNTQSWRRMVKQRKRPRPVWVRHN